MEKYHVKKVEIVSTPSHDYAKVKKKELKDFGILKKISSCSYESHFFIFLEEDRDLTIYLKKLEEEGINYEFKEVKHIENISKMNIRRIN